MGDLCLFLLFALFFFFFPKTPLPPWRVHEDGWEVIKQIF